MSSMTACLAKPFAIGSIARSKDTKSYKVLSEVMQTVERHKFNGSFYEYATFSVKGVSYFINYEGSLWKMLSNGMYREMGGCWVKNRVYKDYVVGGANIKSHVLVMACLTDWFFDKYMSDDNLVVNHCVECSYNDSYRGILYKPLSVTSSDIRYLELVSQELNIRHGRFVKRYELFNTYVSAFDLDKLEELYEEANFVDIRGITKEFYRNKNMKIDFT